MSNHEWESMNERDFETMLEKSVLDFPLMMLLKM